MNDHNDSKPVMASLADPTETPSGGGRWTTRFVILLVIGLVLGPMLISGIPREIGRWHLAAAVRAWYQEDHDKATESFEKALEWNEDDPQLYLYRAQWRMAREDYNGGLEDCQTLLDLTDSKETAYTLRSQIYQHQGQHDKAIADWKELAELHKDSGSSTKASMLNGYAYARVLGDAELEEAFKDIQQALKLYGTDNAAMLDTRGYILCKQGKFEDARHDLDEAITKMEADLEAISNTKEYSDEVAYKHELKEFKKSFAVLLYHRAEILEKLNESDAAQDDRERILELGFKPGPHLF